MAETEDGWDINAPWTIIDLTGLKCPLMSMMLRKNLREKQPTHIRVHADAALAEIDLQHTLLEEGYQLLQIKTKKDFISVDARRNSKKR